MKIIKITLRLGFCSLAFVGGLWLFRFVESQSDKIFCLVIYAMCVLGLYAVVLGGVGHFIRIVREKVHDASFRRRLIFFRNLTIILSLICWVIRTLLKIAS